MAHLLTTGGTGLAGPGAFLHVLVLGVQGSAFGGAEVADFRAGGTGQVMEGGIAEHEVGRGLADLRAVSEES